MYNTYKNIKKASLLFAVLVISGRVFSQTVTDSEIKKNVAVISSPLQKLVQLSPKTFEYDIQKFKHLNLEHGVKYGFIAEELQQVFPSMVKQKSISYMFGKNSYRDTKIKTIDEASLIPVLVASIQQQQQQIQKLTEEVEALKNKKSTAAR
ncbi:tail fiber domain-containing protein [Ferruginibacter sp.]|nr:tail fiber domain-containing protein [Ferruginibacter sp.]